MRARVRKSIATAARESSERDAQDEAKKPQSEFITDIQAGKLQPIHEWINLDVGLREINALLSGPTPYLLEITLPGLPRTANGSHGHWRAKAAEVKKWKQSVFTVAWPKRPLLGPLAHAAITLTRYSSVEPDYDNLVISFKPIIDGLRQAKIITDDKRSNIGRPEYLWAKCKPKDGKITIKVEEKK